MTQTYLSHDWFPRALPSNVEIGEGSWFYSTFALRNYQSQRPCGLKIGCRTGIYIHSFFDIGRDGEVMIGDLCTISGPTFSTNARIEVKNRVLISEEVVIADHFATIPPGQGERPGRSLATITIGDDCWVGTRAVILGGARLGTGVIVGAGAVVDFEVPAYAIVAGNPARVVGWARPGQGSEIRRDET